MHIDAICETNGKGWLIWAAQCPGAFARGATENEARPSKAACTPKTPIPTCCSRPTAPR